MVNVVDNTCEWSLHQHGIILKWQHISFLCLAGILKVSGQYLSPEVEYLEWVLSKRVLAIFYNNADFYLWLFIQSSFFDPRTEYFKCSGHEERMMQLFAMCLSIYNRSV